MRVRTSISTTIDYTDTDRDNTAWRIEWQSSSGSRAQPKVETTNYELLRAKFKDVSHYKG